MSKIVALYLKSQYSMPITSGILLVLALPPFDMWYLGFVVLIPFYFFLLREKSMKKIFNGGVIFGFISQYLIFTAIANFHWLPAAYLFANLVAIAYVLIIILTSILIGLASVLMALLMKRSRAPYERVLIMGIFVLNGLLVGALYLGTNYNSFAYVGVHMYIFRVTAGIGGTVLLSFLVVFSSVALGELILFLVQKKKGDMLASITPIILIIFILLLLSYTLPVRNSTIKNNSISSRRTLSIAVIQDPARKGDIAFGNTVNKQFNFPLLKHYISNARILNPDVIIYPFSPWDGIISDKIDNRSFNKKAIVTSFSIFGKWLMPQVSPKTIFVTWGTALRGGLYKNEIEFWKNGKLIGTYEKRKAFPFMDYTPTWAQHLGIYSTPFDITEGTSTAPILINNINVGSLVCSEVLYSSVAMKNAKDADILFSIGSEGMFSNSIAGEFDLMDTQLRAVETGRPIVRGDKFGPSAIINKNGGIRKELPYGGKGVLYESVLVPSYVKSNSYDNNTQYYLLGAFIMYMLFIWFRKQK